MHTIHRTQGRQSIQLASLLSTRRAQGKLTREQKQLILDQIKASGGLSWTESVVKELFSQLVHDIQALETDFGVENPVIRASLELLRI